MRKCRVTRFPLAGCGWGSIPLPNQRVKGLVLPSLKLTASLPLKIGWLEYDCVLLGPGLFFGAMLVQGVYSLSWIPHQLVSGEYL